MRGREAMTDPRAVLPDHRVNSNKASSNLKVFVLNGQLPYPDGGQTRCLFEWLRQAKPVS